jgi:NADPH-dependent curcumin reductase
MILKNKQVKLASRPVGLPTAENWETTTIDVPHELQEGEVVVKVKYISLDPAMRGWMTTAKSYIKPVEIGEVMRAGGVGKVIASRNEKFKGGDYVTGTLGVQEYYHSENGKGLSKINTELAPITTYLSTLGMVGMTAYFGLLDIGLPKAGEVVVVSGAAGAVGTIVGQIAKIKGCRVVGIAGGQDKCDYLVNELGFYAAIDYKKGKLRSDLRTACPEGIDVYFDNVGGEMLDTVLTMIRKKARIIICGAISQYNSTEGVKGPTNYLSLLVNSARMEGFVVFDFAAKYHEGMKELAQWMAEGKIKTPESIVEGGVDKFNETFLTLFEGDKIGKLILKV